MSLTRISLILSILMCVSLGQIFAQRAAFKPQVHELSLQVGSINSIPSLSDAYENGAPLSLHPVNGIRYTYHYSLSDGFRVGAFRRKAGFNFPEGLDQFQEYQADKKDWDFHLGYKRMYHMGQAQIFGGADLIYTRGKVEAMAMQGTGTSVPDNYAFQNFGMSGFFGYSFFFNTHFSLTLEAEAYYTGGQQRNALGPGEPLNVYLQEDGELGLNASVYLNFHLVKMKKRCTCPKGR